MKRSDMIAALLNTRGKALLNLGKLPEVKKTRASELLKEASKPVPRVTRLKALLTQAVQPVKKSFVARSSTRYFDRKNRRFYITMRNAYVVRQDEKSLYGRKAYRPIRKLSSVPLKIRPKRLPKGKSN